MIIGVCLIIKNALQDTFNKIKSKNLIKCCGYV